MANVSTQAAVRQIKVPFHGAELYVVERDGQPYAPMKPIVEGMGLDWGGQHKKLAANQDRWGVSVMEMPSAGGPQSALCLPLRKLGGWLMTVHASRVRAEIRDRIVQYQNECDDALWQYWNEGIAINPRIGYSVNGSDVLTKDEQDVLRRAVEGAVKHLPKEKRAAAIIKMWSKLKSHFKVSYREIPRIEFTEALSIVQRTAAEWEIVDDKPAAQGIQFAVPGHGRYLVVASSIGSYVYNADGMSLIANDDIARMKRDMLTLGDAMSEMRRRMRVFTGEEERVILLKPVAIDMRVM